MTCAQTSSYLIADLTTDCLTVPCLRRLACAMTQANDRSHSLTFSLVAWFEASGWMVMFSCRADRTRRPAAMSVDGPGATSSLLHRIFSSVLGRCQWL